MSEETTGSVETTEDTGSSVDWKASLEDGVKNDPSLADIQDVSGLAKSYIHAQKMVGADKVALPKENASEEELNTFYSF